MSTDPPVLDLYTYKAKVASIYDGDTVRMDIDLGFGVWVHRQSIRLYGIDTPEIRGKERKVGLEVRDYVVSVLGLRAVYLHTKKDKKGKYGRWLGVIWYQNKDGEWINLNDHLVETGRAERRDY